MSVYETANMFAGQLSLVLLHNKAVRQGSVEVIPVGELRGVYVNPHDVPKENGGL